MFDHPQVNDWKQDTMQANWEQAQEQTAAGASRELLTFTLGREEYGIDILKVLEIRGYDAVTTIANAPEFINGVINLRGIIVPVVDMRIKFKLGNVTYDETTVEERMVILADIEKKMTSRDMELVGVAEA
jgi:chemotaxis signal transduction protein